MNLLNPDLLPALAPLLALPLVIHFLNKRFPRRFNFSSVENLRKTAAERSRFYRWRHRILTVARTLFLLFLLLVFLKPVLDRFGNASPNHTRQVLIVIDHSMSMEYREGGMTTHARADFTQANIAAARLLANANGNGDAEIYYVSNFQRKNWAEVDFQTLADLARVFFVDVGPESFSNHAILGAAIDQTQVLAGDTVPLGINIGNLSDAPLDAPAMLRVILSTSSVPTGGRDFRGDRFITVHSASGTN
jgi:hypothetical protein